MARTLEAIKEKVKSMEMRVNSRDEEIRMYMQGQLYGLNARIDELELKYRRESNELRERQQQTQQGIENTNKNLERISIENQMTTQPKTTQ